jgi:uncharacterized protein (DUF1499 family)
MENLIPLALPIAIDVVTLSILAVIAARIRLLSPLWAFGLFSLSMVGGGGVAALLGGIGALRGGEGSGAALFAAAIGFGCILLVLAIAWGARKAPAIHDITTDLADPPPFVVAAQLDANRLRDMSYPDGGPDTALQQRRAYPDLAPIEVEQPPDEAFAIALRAAAALGWTVTARDEIAGRFEATDESAVFRFVDDIVVRVRPAGTGSVIDARSLSRVGVGDMGINARRLRAFREALPTGRR